MIKYYYPEKYVENITNQNACTLQLNRQFNIDLNNEYLNITYKFNYLSDKNQIILINNIEYPIQIIPDIIQRYLISGGSLTLNCEQSHPGYIFGYINNNQNIEYNNINNIPVKINHGLRMVYIPNNIKLSNINTFQNEFNTYFHIYSKSQLKGNFNIKLCINVNYIPHDKEMFTMLPASTTNEWEFKNNIIHGQNEQIEK
jgi:hypothetical protein